MTVSYHHHMQPEHAEEVGSKSPVWRIWSSSGGLVLEYDA